MAHPRLEARRSTWIDWTDRAARERRESERLNVRTSRSTYKPYGSTTTLIDKKRVVFACWPLGLSSSSLSSRPFFFSARILLSIDRRSFVPCILAIFSEEKKNCLLFLIRRYKTLRIIPYYGDMMISIFRLLICYFFFLWSNKIYRWFNYRFFNNDRSS